MFVVVRHYRFDPQLCDELDRAVNERLVPMLRQAPGFVECYWLELGTGHAASLCVFDDQLSARAAMESGAGLLGERLGAEIHELEGIEGLVRVYANYGL
jgi:hypothetical protein